MSNRLIFKTTKDEYELVRYLGGGTYGAVYKVKSKNTGKDYAVKVFLMVANELNLTPEKIEERIRKPYSDFKIESKFGRLLKDGDQCSPYVACNYDEGEIEGEKMINFFPSVTWKKIKGEWKEFKSERGTWPKLYFLVQELMDGDIMSIRLSNLAQMKELMEETLKGIQWMHQKGLAHNDIKNGNIFYKRGIPRPIYKIGDLGSACSPANSLLILECSGFATPIYASPYILMNFWEPITLKRAMQGDMWSLGVVYFTIMNEFINRKTLYDALPYDYNRLSKLIYGALDFTLPTPVFTENNIYRAEFVTNKGNPEDLRKINEVINGLLNVNDDDRLTADEALRILSA